MKNTKFVKIFSFILVAVMMVGCFASCGTPASAAESMTYISLRINPEIELVADEDGKVIAANAVNEDGEVALAELNLIGMDYDEAGEAFTNKAVELGYIDIDTEDAAVYVGVDGENAEEVEEKVKSLTDRINRYFDNKGIYGKVSPEVFEKYAAEAEAWGVSTGHAKMIFRILDMYPEMTPNEVLALSVKDRIALIRDNQNKNGISAALKEEYRARIGGIKDNYADMFALGEEIDSLKASLENTELTDEERAAIEADITAKEAEFKTMHDAFKAECSTAKEEYKQLTKDNYQAMKDEHKERKSENEAKIKAHEEKFKNDKDTIVDDIQDWRGGKH